MLSKTRSLIRAFAAIAVLAGLTGCASGPAILADYDPATDFSKFKTWDFIENAGPDYEGYESLFSQYMMEAIEIEMDKRGYVRDSNNPDLFLNFNAIVQDKTKITQTPSMGPPMGYGYYGYRGGYYGAWGGYPYGTETRVRQYEEGTFNIDMVDASKMQLVWEAVVIGKITDKARENLRQTVMEGVPEFFAKFPYVAGSNQRVSAED